MRILIMGAGRMGRFFADVLSFQQHEVAMFDTNPNQLKFAFNTQRMTKYEEVEKFNPELVINSVTIKYTLEAFKSILPHISKDCIISDIASVKTGLKEFYENSGYRYVSTHPMFGPTFANLTDLSKENAIIISESDCMGKAFFKELYRSLNLNIFEYSFVEHDETIAYSLSIPFASTLVFISCMKAQEAPGTTFKKHLTIAQGLMSEDDYLLSEVMFNPFAVDQVENICKKLNGLLDIMKKKDQDSMHKMIESSRDKVAKAILKAKKK